MFHDNIETDVITMAVQAGENSNFHAWCENGDGNMLISNILLPLKSARRYCQGRIRISCRNFLRKKIILGRHVGRPTSDHCT